jgi:hypothetical protein
LTAAGDAVASFKAKMSGFMEGGGLVDVIAGIKVFGTEAAYRFKSVGLAAQLLWSAMSDSADSSLSYVVNFAKASGKSLIENFKLIGAWAKAAWDKIKSPTSEFVPPDTTAFKTALRELADAAIGKDSGTLERTRATLREIESLNITHLNNIERLEGEHLRKKQEFAKKKADAEKKAIADALAAEQEAERERRHGTVIENTKEEYEGDVEKAKAAEDKATAAKKTTEEEVARRRTMFLSRSARAKERAEQKAWNREQARIDRALEQGRKGRTGAHITRAREIQAAHERQMAAEDRAIRARMEREAAEERLREAMDRTAKATESIDEQIGEVLNPADS